MTAAADLQECNRARGLLAGVQGAFPEVAQLVRTVQLSHKILFKKGAFIAELAQTGPSLACPLISACHVSVSASFGTPGVHSLHGACDPVCAGLDGNGEIIHSRHGHDNPHRPSGTLFELYIHLCSVASTSG